MANLSDIITPTNLVTKDGTDTLTNKTIAFAGNTLTGVASTGANTFTGAQNFARATVASHATTAGIWAAAGNQIDFTGTATVTAFPNAPQGGAGGAGYIEIWEFS